jgi:protein-S-isoprenylcysteine O-methyltransferase Ste14
MVKLLSAAETLYGLAFVVRFIVSRVAAPAPSGTSSVRTRRISPWAAAALALHAAGIVLVNDAFLRRLLSHEGLAPSSLAVVGLALVFSASALAIWALWVFRSWRLLAQLDAGHMLCVDGPFRLVRHPIYLTLDLWALGNLLVFPSPAMAAGAVIVFVAGDLRARAEERVLVEGFGKRYQEYAARVRRFLPGVY